MKKQEELNKLQVKDNYINQHKLRKVSYDEVLELLQADNIFEGIPKNDFEEDDVEDYDSEREYIETIYFAEGNIEINGRFQIPGEWMENVVLVVKGNLIIHGEVSCKYYVTGNAEFDYVAMHNWQVCKGIETVKYIQTQMAEDDEALRHSRKRKITAPYFFSWFYDLNAYEFNPHTCIFALYDWSELQHYTTDNPLFIWKEHIFALKKELYWDVDNYDSNHSNWDTSKIYNCLKRGESIFIDGFDVNCMSFFQKGKEILRKEKDYELAFLYFKQVIELSPLFYLGYESAGFCLQEVQAFANAKSYYKKGIPLIPEKAIYPEFVCAEKAGLCAIQLGNYEEAIEYADIAIKRNHKNAFALRVKAEALIYLGKPKDAKLLLEESIKLKVIFSNNWLLGLIYYRENNNQKAKEYFAIAQSKNKIAKYYDEHQNLSYVYGLPAKIDWENKSLKNIQPKVKDQNYWNDYFYKNIESTPPHNWGNNVIVNIPEEFHTRQMLEFCLNNKDFNGRDLHFFHSVIDKELALKILLHNNCYVSQIPKHLIDKELCLNSKYFSLSDVPENLWDYEICYKAICHSYHDFDKMPKEFNDEKMKIAAIAGGAFKKYSKLRLPKKYTAKEYLFQAIDIRINTIRNLPAKMIDKDVFEYAKAKYGHTDEWKELVSNHDRNSYKKNNRPEFYYDTFEKVWACFWDENFILKAITIPSESGRIYDIPEKYITQKIADAAVTKNSYDFKFVPKQFITQKMCEIACSKDYGDAIEYVPVSMRTKKVCELSVARSKYNLKFVPVKLRSRDLCIAALIDSPNNIKFVPYELYVEVSDKLFRKYKKDFYEGYSFLYRGIGYFFEGKYNKAIADFQKVRVIDEEDPSDVDKQESYYYEGWAFFKMNNLEKAKELYDKSQEFKDNQEYLTMPYEKATLPKVESAIWDFSKDDFDRLMEEISINIEYKDYQGALNELDKAEKMLTQSQCSNMSLWAIVWDHKRYALYEAGKKEESLEVSKKSIEVLSQIMLWDYIAEFNPIRHALRAMHNSIAYDTYETASNIEELNKGLKHSDLSFSIFSPIEDKSVLYQFYDTRANLLNKMKDFNKVYEKELDKTLDKIKKLNLKKKGILSEEFIEKFKV